MTSDVETPEPNAYQAHKERARERQARLSRAGREIGPLPLCVDPDRRAACEHNLAAFLTTYLADVFCCPWTDNQLSLIARAEHVVAQGGMHAVAIERGGGKSAICEGAVLWAILYGKHAYVCLLNATDEKFAEEALVSIRTTLESNDLLLEDFPEVCYPIRALEGIPQRAAGQTLDGEPTYIGWSGKKRIVLPTVRGAVSSSAVIGGGGMKVGSIRGTRFKTRAGKWIRPSLCILDDIQTDETAHSVEQTEKLYRLLNGAVLGMAGPGAKLSVLFPCTVIEPGDLADRLTDRTKSPEWKGFKSALLESWPVNLELWEKWHELRTHELQGDSDLDSPDEDPAPQSTQFIRDHYRAMHEGAKVASNSRRRPYEVSELQHAMRLYFRDPLSFWSEYQNWIITPNAPASPLSSEDLRLDPRIIAGQISGYEAGRAATECQWATAFVDCHDRVLYWMVVGWHANFTGQVLDYGTFPDTNRRDFTNATYRPTLRERYAGAGSEGALTQGLRELIPRLLVARPREDRTELAVTLCLIDTGYQTKTIRAFLRTSPQRDRLLGSLGRQQGPNEVPMSLFRQRPGERLGDDWTIRTNKARLKEVQIDTYAWKTFVARRLKTTPGDRGALTLPGRHGSTIKHDLLARHLTSEQGVLMPGKWPCHVWRIRPGETENHWFDCLVGCAVAASIQGAKIDAETAQIVARPAQTIARAQVNLTGLDGRPFFVTR